MDNISVSEETSFIIKIGIHKIYISKEEAENLYEDLRKILGKGLDVSDKDYVKKKMAEIFSEEWKKSSHPYFYIPKP